MVVCRADPRSRRWPRPIPSNWHRNSFNPFESRFTCEAALDPVFVTFTGAAATADATCTRGDAIPCRGRGAPWSVRNLSNKLILIGRVCARLHGHGLERRRAGRFLVSVGAPRILSADDSHFAVNFRSLFDGKAKRRYL